MPIDVDQVVVAHGVHVAADEPVDVGGRQPGVGDRGEGRLRRQRQVAAARVAAVVGLADADDRAPVTVVVLGIPRHAPILNDHDEFEARLRVARMLSGVARTPTDDREVADMSWDFETDEVYQKELDWVDEFVREEVEPVDMVIDHAWDLARSGAPGADPAAPGRGARPGAVGDAPRPAPRRAGLRAGQAGAAQRDPRTVAQRTDRVRLPGAGLRQRRDPRPLRERRAQAALPRAAAAQRDRLGVLDDRTGRRLRPDGVRHPRRARRRRMGHQRREVVLVARQLRLVPHPARRHRPRGRPPPPAVDVRRPRRHARRRDPAQRRRSTATTRTRARTATSATPTCASRPTTSSAGAATGSSSPRPASAAAASTTPCAPSDWSSRRST